MGADGRVRHNWRALASSAVGRGRVEPSGQGIERRYLDLLKLCLTRAVFESYQDVPVPPDLKDRMEAADWKIVHRVPVDPALRAVGRDWPAEAETMIGLARLDNIEHCVAEVLRDGVPGDLIETGVWRGGATIFMRAVLEAYGDRRRCVWVADSFHGLPRPDGERYPADAGDEHWTLTNLVVGLEEVKANFAKYGLLDERVRFLPGWFRDTLPGAPIERLAVCRLDGDMYGSTWEALEALYPRLSPGGFLIVDDYGAIAQCRQAVEDFRAARGIAEPVQEIDWTGVYWRKEREAAALRAGRRYLQSRLPAGLRRS